MNNDKTTFDINIDNYGRSSGGNNLNFLIIIIRDLLRKVGNVLYVVECIVHQHRCVIIVLGKQK